MQPPPVACFNISLQKGYNYFTKSLYSGIVNKVRKLPIYKAMLSLSTGKADEKSCLRRDVEKMGKFPLESQKRGENVRKTSSKARRRFRWMDLLFIF